MTEGYRGDRETVIKLLNEALATEIVCVLRYKRHYFMAQGIHSAGRRRGVPASTRTRSRGTPTRSPSASCSSAASPNFNPDGPRDAQPLRVRGGRRRCVDMIKEDLVAERIAIDSYSEMIRYIGDKDADQRAACWSDPGRRGRARRGHAPRCSKRSDPTTPARSDPRGVTAPVPDERCIC